MLGARGWAVNGTMPAHEEICRGRGSGRNKVGIKGVGDMKNVDCPYLPDGNQHLINAICSVFSVTLFSAISLQNLALHPMYVSAHVLLLASTPLDQSGSRRLVG